MVRSDQLRRSVRWLLLVATWLLAYVVALASVELAADAHNYWLVVVLAIGVAVFGWFLHGRLDEPLGRRVTSTARVAVLIVVTEAGVIALAIGHFQPFSPSGFIGLSLILFGLGQIIAEMRRANWLNRTVAVFALINAVAIFVAYAIAGIGGVPFFALGVLLLYPALTFGTEVSLDLLADSTHSAGWLQATIPVAVVLVIGGAALLWSVGQGWFTLTLVLVVLVVVGAITSNTEADWLIVLASLAIIWSQFPREAALPKPPPQGAVQMVVFGDSYVSGEGAKKYFQDTNTTSSGKYDKCRRAPTAWPFVLASDKKFRKIAVNGQEIAVLSVACSGASTDNITTEGQYIGENPRDKRAKQTDGNEPRKFSQLEKYESLPDRVNPQWVFVSIGGNDVDFGDIVQACILPGDCSVLGQRFLDGLTTLPPKLHSVYAALAHRFPGKVIVVPYPIPIRDHRCNIFSSTLVNREHQLLYNFTAQLDNVIERQAAADHLPVITDMPDALQPRLRICDRGAAHVGVNYIALNPQQGAIIDPTGWVHNSMHPNKTGHQQLAAVVATWLEHHPTLRPASPTKPPVLDLHTLLDDQRHSIHEVADKTTTAAWKSDQIRLALLHRGLGMILLLTGMWLVWIDILLVRRLLGHLSYRRRRPRR